MMGFLPALALVLIILKLCGVITCSWWLVLLPILILPIVIIWFIMMAILFNRN